MQGNHAIPSDGDKYYYRHWGFSYCISLSSDATIYGCNVGYSCLYDSFYIEHLTTPLYVSSFGNISFLTCESYYVNENLGQAAPSLLHARHVSLP